MAHKRNLSQGRNRVVKKLILAGVTLAMGSSSAEVQEMGYGQTEYRNSCAVCHGEQGEGNGTLAAELKTPPADLTSLAERNGGEFPYWRVFAVIDGRYVVPGHGGRDMPVWGRQFLEDDQRTYGPIGGEALTQERIHELAEHIQSLQR